MNFNGYATNTELQMMELNADLVYKMKVSEYDRREANKLATRFINENAGDPSIAGVTSLIDSTLASALLPFVMGKKAKVILISRFWQTEQDIKDDATHLLRCNAVSSTSNTVRKHLNYMADAIECGCFRIQEIMLDEVHGLNCWILMSAVH